MKSNEQPLIHFPECTIRTTPEEAEQIVADNEAFEEMLTPKYTHIGYRRTVGHVHAARLYGHGNYEGKVHALNGSSNIHSGGAYQSLCGKSVRAEHDGEAFNVAPAGSEGWRVTCKRCKAVITKDTFQGASSGPSMETSRRLHG